MAAGSCVRAVNAIAVKSEAFLSLDCTSAGTAKRAVLPAKFIIQL
jgi:hypothetical protein